MTTMSNISARQATLTVPLVQRATRLLLSTIVALVLCLSQLFVVVNGKVECDTTQYCESTLRVGSKCIDGYCDNPYQYGCLINRRPGYEQHKLRVCNSDDPPDASSLGICRTPSSPSGMEYPEIRIMSQNWESPFFEVRCCRPICAFVFVCFRLKEGYDGLIYNALCPLLSCPVVTRITLPNTLS